MGGEMERGEWSNEEERSVETEVGELDLKSRC